MTKLELIDARIKEVESTLVYLLHERLVLVKCEKPVCEHKNRVLMCGLYIGPNHPLNHDGFDLCSDCGMRIPV